MATKKSYTVPEGEEGHVHASLRIKAFSPEDGQPLYKAFTQKFDPKAWVNFLEHRGGLEILEVMHIPTGVKTVAKSDAEKKAKLTKELKAR